MKVRINPNLIIDLNHVQRAWLDPETGEVLLYFVGSVSNDAVIITPENGADILWSALCDLAPALYVGAA